MATDLIMEELQKIDMIRDRTGLSFADARQLLEENNWNVMEALITYEQTS